MSPDYMSALFVWPWICLPIFALGMMVAGFFAMRKIVQIEV
jgi:Flp pilus assembly protein TadB